MRFRSSRHAEWEIHRRNLPRRLVEAVAAAPEQRVPDGYHPGIWIYQSRVLFEDGRIYLLRVAVAEAEEPPVIITAYKTSKIQKYWSPE